MSTGDGNNLYTVEPAGPEGLTPADLKRAGLVTCGYATDTKEARTFLDMLGLTEDLKSINSSGRV